MTQATPNPARDTRPTVAGHPLPWKIIPGRYEWDKCDFDIVDATDEIVWRFDEDELAGFWRGLVEFLNRYHSDDFFVRAHEMANRGVTTLEEASAMWGLPPIKSGSPNDSEHVEVAGAPCEDVLKANAEYGVYPSARIVALEAALIAVLNQACILGNLSDRQASKLFEDILDRVGLAHRLRGNQANAEQVTA